MKPVKALGRGSVASIMRGLLGISWVLLWLGAAATLLVAIAYIVASIMVASGGLDPQWLHEKSQYIRLRNADIENYRGPDWLLVWSTLLLAGIGTAGGLVIVWRLRKLFDTFLSGEPFRRENAYHLRIIWITMLAVEISRLVLMGVFGVLIRVLGGPDLITRPRGGDFSIMTWSAILILIVLAEIFREGARLKEEQELTI